MWQESADSGSEVSAISPSLVPAGREYIPALEHSDQSSILKTLQLALANVHEIAQGHGLWNGPKQAWGLSIQTEKSADGTEQLLLSGDLDCASAPLLEDCLASAQDGNKSVMVDLEDLTFMDSSGVDVFLHASNRAEDMGGLMHIVNCGRHRRVFVLCDAAFLLGEPEVFGPLPGSSRRRHPMAS